MVAPQTWAIVACYIIATLAISLLVSRRKAAAASDDYATGGKQFGWFTAGISILATYVSAMTFIGMPGWVYNSGLEALSVHLNYPLVIFVAVTLFVPLFYKLGLTSIYEYLERRFGVVARSINAVVFLLVQCISAGVILYAVALVLVRVLPLSVEQAILCIGLFTALYSYFGGISTVIWTDMLQTLFLVTGSVAIFAILLGNLGDMPAPVDLADKLQIANFSLDPGVDTTLWAGVVAVSFLHLSVYGTNQLIIQRTLATRNVETAQKSMLLCGYGTFFVYAFFALLGLLLYRFYSGAEFANSNDVILDFVFNHTNPWVIGLILSALCAAAMSTLDSTYNSMATVATFDIYKRFMRQDASATHYQRVARNLSLPCAAMVLLPALLSVSNESVLKTIASLTSLFVGIRLGSFLLGLLFRRANEAGVIGGSMLSVVAIAACKLAGIAWPWYAPAGTVAFLVAGVLTSLRFGKNSEQNLQFFAYQQQLLSKPKLSHHLLWVFALALIGGCIALPKLLAGSAILLR